MIPPSITRRTVDVWRSWSVPFLESGLEGLNYDIETEQSSEKIRAGRSEEKKKDVYMSCLMSEQTHELERTS